jgi:homoserine dehydrogenase
MSLIKVLKFGSSVLRAEEDLPLAVHEIYREWRRGAQVLAVVSAFGDTTDGLLARAECLCLGPEPAALAALLATGEATSAALLGLALARAGVPAKVLDPAQAGLLTRGGRLDAELISADTERLHEELRRGVVVLPGFVGRDAEGGTTLLGRGGSDLTALFLAEQLGGRCVLVKDVDGLYTADPARPALARPRRFERVSWGTAAAVGGKVVQPKAVRFAESRWLGFEITSPGAAVSTEVCQGPDLRAARTSPAAPLRVALLGCGTVGGGVYERLAALPEFFEVTGVATRTPARALSAGVPAHLIAFGPEELFERDCDVVVELFGGVERAGELVSQALRLGRHVVTANTALVAEAGGQLEALAAASRATLRYSAAVGGALPALETVGRLRACGRVGALTGVLNGTSNFVLDLLAAGEDFDSAVRAAQAAGFAEADPTLDLDGTDAAQKLAILARHAFGIDVNVDEVRRVGLDRVEPERVRAARDEGFAVRLVASCRRTGKGVEASVTPTELPLAHPLATTEGAENRLLVETEAGECHLVTGRGAGRWPTTEAVLADLFDLRREVCVAGFRAAAAAFAAPYKEACVA